MKLIRGSLQSLIQENAGMSVHSDPRFKKALQLIVQMVDSHQMPIGEVCEALATAFQGKSEVQEANPVTKLPGTDEIGY